MICTAASPPLCDGVGVGVGVDADADAGVVSLPLSVAFVMRGCSVGVPASNFPLQTLPPILQNTQLLQLSSGEKLHARIAPHVLPCIWILEGYMPVEEVFGVPG